MSRRFFKHGELPLVLLSLVATEPRHGYEIMSELTRLFGPRYKASPGSIYPAIEALQVERLIAGAEESGRIVYSITTEGLRALDDRAELLAALEYRLDVTLNEIESLDVLLTRFKARLAPLSGRVDASEASQILESAASEIELLNINSSTKPNKRRSHA
ncbi:MAG: PadR family transcriptional regulator [Solirubrobacterales bacterium]|nr:PadR family transcriptional regulator [Solirubrobacterales bacterium]